MKQTVNPSAVARKFHEMKASKKFRGVVFEVLYDDKGFPVATHIESIESGLEELPAMFPAMALSTAARVLARSTGIPLDTWIAAITEVDKALEDKENAFEMVSSSSGGPLPN